MKSDIANTIDSAFETVCLWSTWERLEGYKKRKKKSKFFNNSIKTKRL